LGEGRGERGRKKENRDRAPGGGGKLTVDDRLVGKEEFCIASKKKRRKGEKGGKPFS